MTWKTRNEFTLKEGTAVLPAVLLGGRPSGKMTRRTYRTARRRRHSTAARGRHDLSAHQRRGRHAAGCDDDSERDGRRAIGTFIPGWSRVTSRIQRSPACSPATRSSDAPSW